MSTNYAILKQALLSRSTLSGIYDGLPRVFCPHIVGTKAGEENALCFQTGGQSSSPLPPEGQWKCFKVAKLSDLQQSDAPWKSGDKGFKPSSCVDIVDVQIDL